MTLKIEHGNYTNSKVKPSDVESKKDSLQVLIFVFLMNQGEYFILCFLLERLLTEWCVQNQTKPQCSLGRYIEALIIIAVDKRGH